jgi:hypothetical protein
MRVSIFDFSWGQVVWPIVTVLVAGGVVTGAVFTVRYFVRLNRRVDNLTRNVAGLAEDGRRAADREG